MSKYLGTKRKEGGRNRLMIGNDLTVFYIKCWQCSCRSIKPRPILLPPVFLTLVDELNCMITN